MHVCRIYQRHLHIYKSMLQRELHPSRGWFHPCLWVTTVGNLWRNRKLKIKGLDSTCTATSLLLIKYSKRARPTSTAIPSHVMLDGPPSDQGKPPGQTWKNLLHAHPLKKTKNAFRGHKFSCQKSLKVGVTWKSGAQKLSVKSHQSKFDQKSKKTVSFLAFQISLESHLLKVRHSKAACHKSSIKKAIIPFHFWPSKCL